MNIDIEQIQKQTEPILKSYGIEYAGIFGSAVNGTLTPDSDLDILVKPFPDSKFSLFDLVGLEREISEAINMPADIVTENGISPYIKEIILKDLQPIYEQR
jgi:uncharacterized protein